MTVIAGLDLGSFLSKAVIMKDNMLLAHSIRPTAGNFSRAAEEVLEDALAKAGLFRADIDLTGANGLGAAFAPEPFTRAAEISCQSRGGHYLFPTVRTLIEVGSQASRVVKITKTGRVADFLVSDTCAAGSGRVLQVIAKVLGVRLEDMGRLSLSAVRPARFTTGCVVFLETEAISRVAEGTPVEDIIAGLHLTLASRISALAQRLKIEEDCAVTGGGAMNDGLVAKLAERIGKDLRSPDTPLITGAIGAALIAAEKNVDPDRG